MSIDAASNSTRMTIGTLGNVTGSAVGAAHGRDRNPAVTGGISTDHTSSPLLAAPVASMARSHKKTVRLQELQPRIFLRPSSPANGRLRLRAPRQQRLPG